MIDEPEVVLAATPREWGQRLHRYVTDHGGVRVRATVLHPDDALAERYDVLVADDTTSFLTPRLVNDLRAHSRRVLGVHEAADPHGRDDLVALGVDATLADDAPPEDFVAAVRDLVVTGPSAQPRRPAGGAAATPGETDAWPWRGVPGGGQPPGLDGDEGRARPGGAGHGTGAAGDRGPLTVVAGPCGGCGATEVAVALAQRFARRRPCVLVDADDVGPSLAQRLGLALHPNLRSAVDAVEYRSGDLEELLVPVGGGRLRVLPGLAGPRDWSVLRAPEVVATLRELAREGRQVVADVGNRVEDLTRGGGPARHALARLVLAAADTVVVVVGPGPVALGRLVEWMTDVGPLVGDTPLHVLVNRAPRAPFKRGEISTEIGRAVEPASLAFLPADPRVEAAAWAGTVPARGPFARAVARAAAGLMAEAAVATAGPARIQPSSHAR